MKCNPYNIKYLLDNWSLRDQFLLFNDESHQEIANIANTINQIGNNKRYKLSFILNAFVKMTEVMGENYSTFEPDYDSIFESVADSDYWEEGYKELFDHEIFWRELSDAVDENEIADFLKENFDVNNFITDAFNYGKDDKEARESITKQELIDKILSYENISNLIDDLNKAKINISSRHSNSEILSVGIGNYFNNDFLSKSLNRVDADHRQEVFSEEESILIFNSICEDLTELYSKYQSKIVPNSRSKTQDYLHDNFKNEVFDYWFNQNKSEFERSEAESQGESASYEFSSIDRHIAKTYLGDEEQDPNARHIMRHGFTERIRQHEWIKWDNDHVNIVVENDPFSKLGIDEWSNIADELKTAADENQINGTEYLLSIRKYVDVIKFTIETDPNLKLAFSEESLFYKIEDSDIMVQSDIIADIIDDMPLEEGTKFKEFMSLDTSRAQLIATVQERKKQEEDLKKIKKQNEEEEKRRKDEIYRLVQEEKERHTEESLTKNFGDDEIRKAKELGISKNPFAHKSIMKLDVKSSYSGRREYPESTGTHLTKFHLTVQPKISSNDPPGMSSVFDKDKGLNFHGGLLGDAPSSSDHYNYIGWIRGVIDLYQKIAYVEEMQSDVMQNTPMMKDIEKSLAFLNLDKENTYREIDIISKQMSIDPSILYGNKIQDLRDQLKNIKNVKLIPGIELAIKELEKQKQLGKDPLSKNKEKLLRLNERLKQVEKEIEDVKRYESDTHNVHTRRPHLYEFKSRVERKYEDWVGLFFNSVFKYCDSIGIKKLYIVTATETKKTWGDNVSEGTMSLYEKVYDEQAKKHNMKKIQYKGGSWWALDLLKNKPKFASSWYGKLKFAQSNSVDISDLILKYENKEIDRKALEKMIKERYDMFHNENMELKVFQKIAINYFDIFFKAREDDIGTIESPTEWERMEKIQEALSGFMTTAGSSYRKDSGDLKEPYNSILSRLLIQKYQYDMNLGEMTD